MGKITKRVWSTSQWRRSPSPVTLPPDPRIAMPPLPGRFASSRQRHSLTLPFRHVTKPSAEESTEAQVMAPVHRHVSDKMLVGVAQANRDVEQRNFGRRSERLEIRRSGSGHALCSTPTPIRISAPFSGIGQGNRGRRPQESAGLLCLQIPPDQRPEVCDSCPSAIPRSGRPDFGTPAGGMERAAAV